MTPEKLYEQLKKFQEAKGYFFNKDMTMTMPLMESLLENKKRYGYMACPCRLVNGDYENDRDIICPCEYRDEDLKEYDSCYCMLYVSEKWNNEEVPHDPVPERRPPEKIIL